METMRPKTETDNEIEPCLRFKSTTNLFIVSIFYLTEILWGR